MNSSTNSELSSVPPPPPSSQLVKVKHGSNKENKLQRFGGAVVNGGTLVFGKIKSIWSHNSTGLNTMLADSDRRRLSDEKRKSQDNLGLFLFDYLREFFFVCIFLLISLRVKN